MKRLMGLVVTFLLLGQVCFAQGNIQEKVEKASATAIKVTTVSTNEFTMEISAIMETLGKVNQQLTDLDKAYQDQKAKLISDKARLEGWISQAGKLDTKSNVVGKGAVQDNKKSDVKKKKGKK